MKKLIIASLLISLCSFGAMAQHRTIGLRMSNVLEVSYQRNVSDVNFWEFDGGFWNFGNGAQASAIYNWIIASPEWSPEGEWNWYLGVGGSMGLVWGNKYHYGDEELGCFLGVAGLVGLEYNFWFPLTLSADFRPVVGPYFGDGVYFYDRIIFDAFWPTISARYRF